MEQSKARQYYDDHRERFAAAPEISHILVDEEAQSKELLQRLQSGEDFAALAKAHSKCPSGKEGGKLGRTPVFFYVPEFGEALSGLTEVGQVIGPVKSRFGYHLIRLDGERRDVDFTDCAEMLEQMLPHLESRENA